MVVAVTAVAAAIVVAGDEVVYRSKQGWRSGQGVLHRIVSGQKQHATSILVQSPRKFHKVSCALLLTLLAESEWCAQTCASANIHVEWPPASALETT